jgi:hypothetical protein
MTIRRIAIGLLCAVGAIALSAEPALATTDATATSTCVGGAQRITVTVTTAIDQANVEVYINNVKEFQGAMAAGTEKVVTKDITPPGAIPVKVLIGEGSEIYSSTLTGECATTPPPTSAPPTTPPATYTATTPARKPRGGVSAGGGGTAPRPLPWLVAASAVLAAGGVALLIARRSVRSDSGA